MDTANVTVDAAPKKRSSSKKRRDNSEQVAPTLTAAQKQELALLEQQKNGLVQAAQAIETIAKESVVVGGGTKKASNKKAKTTTAAAVLPSSSPSSSSELVVVPSKRKQRETSTDELPEKKKKANKAKAAKLSSDDETPQSIVATKQPAKSSSSQPPSSNSTTTTTLLVRYLGDITFAKPSLVEWSPLPVSGSGNNVKAAQPSARNTVKFMYLRLPANHDITIDPLKTCMVDMQYGLQIAGAKNHQTIQLSVHNWEPLMHEGVLVHSAQPALHNLRLMLQNTGPRTAYIKAGDPIAIVSIYPLPSKINLQYVPLLPIAP